MNSQERITRHLNGSEVDRIPLVGGWNLGVGSICTWAQMDLAEFRTNPDRAVLEANRGLGVDAITSNYVIPSEEDELRNGKIVEETFSDVEAEALKERALAIPDSQSEILVGFNRQHCRDETRDDLTKLKSKLVDLVPLVTHWGAPAKFSLYATYGYVAFLEAVAVYPEEIEKIFWENGVLARERNKVLAELIVELGLVPAVLCGDDICTSQGPMVSPGFLREKYWPHSKSALAPFVDAGIRLICHCDGNVMPLIDDFLAAGFTGFHGYQYEDGFDPYIVRDKALKYHPNPIFMGGLSVTRTLPFGTDEDVRNDIDYLYRATDGGNGMMLFTSNVSGVDIPPERIARANEYGRTLTPGRTIKKDLGIWPWKEKHPESC